MLPIRLLIPVLILVAQTSFAGPLITPVGTGESASIINDQQAFLFSWTLGGSLANVEVAAPGVSVGTPQYTNSLALNTLYPPASEWVDSNPVFFTLSGDPVPEPGTLLMFGAGCSPWASPAAVSC